MSESNDSTRRTSSGLIALIPKNQVASPTGQHVQRPKSTGLGTFSNFTSRTPEPIGTFQDPPELFGWTLQNLPELPRSPEPSKPLRNLPVETRATHPGARPQAFPIPQYLWNLQTVPRNCAEPLRSFCNIALQSLKIRTVFVAIF